MIIFLGLNMCDRYATIYEKMHFLYKGGMQRQSRFSCKTKLKWQNLCEY